MRTDNSMPQNKVLGIGGSPRKGGNSDVLLKHILAGVQAENVAAETIQLRDFQYKPCTGCEMCQKSYQCKGLQDGMQLIYPKIIQARGLVLVSPTHNYNVTAWIKAFLDRLYCLYMFTDDRPRGYSSSLSGQNRKAVIAAIGEQPSYEEAIGLSMDALRLPLEGLGYEVIGQIPVLGIFDKGKIKTEIAMLEQAEKAGRKLAALINS